MSGPFGDRVFSAVLFDLDGTLIDSTPAVARSWKRWAGEYGVVIDGVDGWHGRPAGQVVAMFLPVEQQAGAIARIQQIEIADVEDLVALPGAAAALIATGERGAIVTSCAMPLARARIAAGALATPKVLVTADQTANGKPDPEPFLLAAQRLGADPASCLVVEDAPAGLSAAAAAGMTRLAVVTTHTPDQLDAEAIVPDLASVRFELLPSGVAVRPAAASGDSLEP